MVIVNAYYHAVHWNCLFASNQLAFNVLRVSDRSALISGSAGPIFAIYSPNESDLGADDRSGFFPHISRDVAMATNSVKKWQTPLFRRSDIPKRNGISLYLHVRINSENDASISCRNFVNFGPITPEVTELICERLVRHGQKNWRILSNISGYTGPIFASFLPYESTLDADNGSVPYFPICQGTLPWQPNNFVRSNECGLILPAFFALAFENELEYHNLLFIVWIMVYRPNFVVNIVFLCK